jgi:hypothetical protein
MARERRVSGRRVDDFPPRGRTRWDFSRVADGQVYLLRKRRDFDVEVDSLATAARRCARARLQAHHPQRVRRPERGPVQGGGVRPVREESCPPTGTDRQLDAMRLG